MSLCITTQIMCDKCDRFSTPYVCLTAVGTVERKRLRALGWKVSVENPEKHNHMTLDFCPSCRGKS